MQASMMGRTVDKFEAHIADPELAEDHGKISAVHVRRDKAALFQWVQAPPGNRSSRKRPEQAWRRRSV
jgi:hypothetical protein